MFQDRQIKLGDYKANRKMRVRMGIRIFIIEEGDIMVVCSVDKKHRKILVRVMNREVDWMSDKLIEDFTYVGTDIS